MIRAVIFDLDDTLYPERAYAMGGFRAVASKFADMLGDPQAAVAEMVQLMGEGQRGRIFNELLSRKGQAQDEALVGQMVAAYRSHRPRIQFHPDAAAALLRLKPTYRLGVITDGAREQQWAKIDALGLRQLVEEIIVTSELTGELTAHPSDAHGGKKTGRRDSRTSGTHEMAGARFPSRTAPAADGRYGKPHPFAFELIVKRFELAHEECAYVADNPSKDFVAPNSLGWLTVQVRRSDGIYLGAAVAEKGEPNRTIDSLDQLDALLR